MRPMFAVSRLVKPKPFNSQLPQSTSTHRIRSFQHTIPRIIHSQPITMSRYAEAHKNNTGPGDARPTAIQIVEDENLVGKLTDKVFFVTGVSSGIGIETMR